MSSRTAIHEAAHAVAAWALGYKASGPVSIVPSEYFNGVCLAGRSGIRLTDADLAALDRPLPLLPARLRRLVEVDVIVSMAGALAAGPMFAPDPEPAVATRRAPAAGGHVRPLPDRDAKLLATATTRPGLSDEELVDKVLWALHGDRAASASAHRMLLEAETVRLLESHADEVRTLAAALDQRGTLSGAEWRRLVGRGGA